MVKRLPPNSHIDVFSTQPNRYASFNQVADEIEEREQVTVHRITLPEHNSNMFDQSRAFYSYYRGVNKSIRNRDYDLVFATSSRLFTAFLGARIAKTKKAKLYLDIRDIFVETMDCVLDTTLKIPLIPLLRLIENYTFLQADKINLVSEGFYNYFSGNYPNLKFDYFTNGIDSEFIDSFSVNKREPIVERNKTKELVIVYAGNIGEGQGLNKILPKLAKRLSGIAKFKVIGDGGRKVELERALKLQGNNNVELLNPISRKELIKYYREADLLFLHLNNIPAFERVLPSKIFEYAAMGKPILAGVGGYAASFVSKNIPSAVVFSPCDSGAAYEAVINLPIPCLTQVSPDFISEYCRENIAKKMADSVLELSDDII